MKEYHYHYLSDPARVLFLVFLCGLAASAVVAWPIYRTLLAVKSRQIVSQYVPEHAKKQGTPTMGGLIIVAGFLLWILVLAILDPSSVSDSVFRPLVVSAWLVFSFGFIGFADDFIVPRMIRGKRGLGWKQKLGMELAFALAAVYMIGGGGGRSPMTMAEEVFTILFFSNAYNFSDGMDWLAGSILVFFALGLIGLCLVNSVDPLFAVACCALVGAAIPFMVLNRPPARIFMGDVGSLPIGAVLGYVAFEIFRQSHGPVASTLATWLSLGILSLVMIVELVPVPLQVASVKLRKKRIFPFTPIHHAFEKVGWKESKVVLMFALTQLACSAAAVGIAWVLR